MADAAPSVNPTWGPGNAPPAIRRRKWLLAAIVGLVLITGIAIGLMFWFAPPRTPLALPIWIVAEPGSASPVPWAAQDRAALLESGVLGRTIDEPTANPNRDQIRLRFQALSRASRRESIVVYLAAAASVDAAGVVYILPSDPLGDHPRNRLPLADLLAAFKDCPARHRLLVLHLTPPHEDPLFALPPGELSAAIYRTLDDTPDAGRLCLVACAPGETPHASPDLGRTAFGYYLEAGLHGAADGWGGDRDGHVNANELASFVRARVSRWAAASLRTPQTPVLLGTAADFTLRTYARGRILQNYPTPPPGEAIAPPTGMTFPDWLKAGWERHDKWLADGRASAAPRAFALLRHALLAAERDLLSGRPAGEVQQSLDKQIASHDALALALSAVPTPDPLPTLAAAFPDYVLPEPALLDDLRTASSRADAAPPPPAPEAGKPIPPPTLPPEFEPFKAKPYPLLALAAFKLLAEDPPSAALVRRLSLLLSTKEPVPKFAEVLFIQRLAALAVPTSPVPWSPQRAALAIQTARDFEDAAARPEVYENAQRFVEEAYRQRADAEAILFAPGFAPAQEADRRLKLASLAAAELKAFSIQLHTSQVAASKASLWLGGAASAAEAGLIPLPAAVRFGTLFAEPGVGAATTLRDRIASLREREAELLAAQAEFILPFRPEVLTQLRNRVESGDADSAALAEADAVLCTPLLPVAERAALWNARAALSRRLSDEVVRKDAAEDDSHRRELSRPQSPDPRSLPPALPADTERTARTARLRKLWPERAAGDLDALRRKELARRLWAWHAERFTYEARDPSDPVPTDAGYKFSSSAARNCAVAAGGPSREPYLDIEPLPELVLRPDETEKPFDVKVRTIGTTKPENVGARAYSPSPAWVTIHGGTNGPFDPTQRIPFQIAVGERPEAHPELKGVLIEAEVTDGRTYHRRMPVELGDLANRLTLTVKPVGEKVQPVRAVELRPNGDPQAYELRLANPGKKAQSVIVRLPQYDRETERLTVEPEKDVKLKFKPPTPSTMLPVPPMGQPATPVDPFDPVKGNELEVVVIDPAEPDKVRQRFTVPVQVLDPADYLRVKGVAFTPAIGNRPNRLALEIVPARVPPGPPVPITATLPRERNPDVVRVRDANLSAPLPANGKSLTLYAENTTFKVGEPVAVGPPSEELPRVTVTVAADGCERVFTFTGRLPPLGGTVRLNPIAYPMVRVRAKPLPLDPKEPPPPAPLPTGPIPVRPYVEPVFASGLVPLPLELEVDNAPDGATVQIRLGTERLDLATGKLLFSPDVTLPLAPGEPPLPAKDRTAKIKFDPKGESLTFKGTLTDPAPTLPVEVLVGRRVIEARLIDRDGQPLRDPDGNEVVGRTRVVFDGAKPTGIEFLGLQPRMPQGKVMVVRATSDLPVSGVKEVAFFLGKPVKDGPPPAAVPVPGVLFDLQTNEWRATLPIENLKGPQTVSVQFVSKAGQVRALPVEIELADPAELNTPPPGSIRGTVTDNDFKQKGLKVFLYDAAAKPVKEAVTDANGLYEFKDMPAGTYFVYAYNVPTRRESKKRVDLKPGAKETIDLPLMLSGRP